MGDIKATNPTADSGQADTKPQLKGWRKLMTDFGPLVLFFASFKLANDGGDQGLYIATGIFMVAIAIAAGYSKLKTGHIALMHKFTFVVVMVMGGLTLYLQDETFVKMKLTVINGIFAAALLVGLTRGQLYIKMLMEMAIEMADEGWVKFTRNYIVFMLATAVLNELIWRTQSTDFWVNFKTFGYIGLTFVFLLAQGPMFAKYMPEEGPEGDAEGAADDKNGDGA